MKSINIWILFVLFTAFYTAGCRNEPQEESSVVLDGAREEASVEIIYDSLKSYHQLIGRWEVFSTDLKKAMFDIEIYQKDSSYCEVLLFATGKDINQLTRQGNKYYVVDNSHGEYYSISSKNDLKMYDHRGIIDEANAGLRVTRK